MRFFARLLVRIPLWILTHTIYRLRVVGAENIPHSGPALLVCNHVTYFDFLFLIAAQKRHIHFVIFAGWTRKWGLGWLLKWAGVIPIDHRGGGRAIIKSLRTAAEYLKEGKLVCIFAEGRFTRTGFLLPFKRGFTQILKYAAAPVIPVYLDQAWGSILSYHGGKLIWKWPHRLPFPITVVVGQPMPDSVLEADGPFQTRQAMQKLSADSLLAHDDRLPLVHRRFVRNAARHPFRHCLLDAQSPKQDLSYGAVLAESICLARAWRGLLVKESIVGVCLPPGADAAIANVTLGLMRKTVINLDPDAPLEKTKSVLQQFGVKSVITSSAVLPPSPWEPEGIGEIIDIEQTRSQLSNLNRTLAKMSVILLPGFVIERRLLGLAAHQADDLATVIVRENEDGQMLAVMLTSRNIAANCESIMQTINPTRHDRLLGVSPFSYSFGYTMTLWLPLASGAAVVYSHGPQQFTETGALCSRRRCTLLLVTADQLPSIHENCQSDELSNVRVMMCGGRTTLPPELVTSFEHKFKVTPFSGYGRHELSPAATVNVQDQTLDGFTQVGAKPGSVGQPLPGVAVNIVDPQTNQPLPPGQQGLVLVFGANVMRGYWDREDLTQESITDGWFNTGERAIMDEDGFVFLRRE